MKKLSDFNWEGKKALIRVDFNVPLNDQFEITDDTRIRAAIPTIQHILKAGGSVVLMSHLGRPKNGPEDKFSLNHLVAKVAELAEAPVQFVNDCIGEEVEKAAQNLKAGTILLLENLRFHPEEKAGDKAFAEKLAKAGDIYVNDAFGTAHRAHASTAVIAQFFPEQKCFGHLLATEIESIEKVLNNAEHPYTAIIGGAKVSSKITIIENLLDKIDYLIIGGGMAYTFAKAQGGKVGNSLVEDDYLDTALKVLEKAKEKNVEVIVPTDSIIADNFSNEANIKVADSNKIENGWMGLDVGPEAIIRNQEVLLDSKTILWNGPMGVFEMSNFAKGTQALAEDVAMSTKNGAFSLVGGGDSVAAVNKFNKKDQVSYVSTGGGALLEYMEGKVLPGIQAILD